MQYLYLIRCQQYYKIGVASDVQSRLAQLSTGNPFELEPVTVCGFDNASAVETVLHQRFASKRTRGEWFALDADDVTLIDKIIYLLGGSAPPVISEVEDSEIEEAEEVQESFLEDGGKWDYAAMYADGWRQNKSDSRGRYWMWRKMEGGERKSIYGGVLSDLPHPIEEMRRIYEKKGNGHES